MKFLLISPKNRTAYNFRGDLIKKIKASNYDVIVTGPDLSDVERITKLGADFKEIPMNKTGTSILSDLKYCFKLLKLFRTEKPDVTLGYTVKPVIYGSIAAKLSGVKHIACMVTGGGYVFTSKNLKARLLGLLVKILYRIAFTCADCVIFQNPDDLDEFCKLKLANRKKCALVNGSGVNMKSFSPAPLSNKPVFFMLSRLLKSKGVCEYLKAAELVKAEYPDAEFNLLGKFEYKMQDAVPGEVVLDYINRGIINLIPETFDVRPYFESCSVYVLPSYREGTPRTVLEAMAMGRPIITTDINGCRETVKDGINGYLVPVGDVKALANAMKRFIENPDLVKPMGNESIRYCKEKFDVNSVNDAMCKFLKI